MTNGLSHYIRQGAVQAYPDVDEIPLALTSRLLSVRAFDERHYLRDADVVDGFELAMRTRQSR